MKVCLACNELSPFSGAGAGTGTRHLAVALARAGHDVHVVTQGPLGLGEGTRPAWRGEHGHAWLPGVKIHEFRVDEGAAAMEAYPCPAMRTAMGLHEALTGLHAEHRFDVIDIADVRGQGYFAVGAKRTLGAYGGATLAIRVHSPVTLLRQKIGLTWLNRADAAVEHMEAYVLRHADAVTSPSQAMLEAMGDVIPGSRVAGRVEAVVRNPWVGEVRTRGREGGSEPLVLGLGRQDWQKGFDYLVRAAGMLLERGVALRVLIVGSDSRTAPGGRWVRKVLRELTPLKWRGHIEIADAAPAAEVEGLISRAAVVAMPSRWENAPYAAIEAMARGVPVVASDAGGTPELIEDGHSGVLFKDGDVEGLAAALERVVKDEGLRERLARGGAARVAAVCDPGEAARAWTEAMERARGTPGARAGARSGSVSVVVPHFNLGRYVGEAVESVLRQRTAVGEVIVVDDGSTEASSVEAIERLEREGRVRVIRQENAGPAAARNRGLREARGEWVMFLDADDVIEPTLVEDLLTCARRCPECGYVTCLMSCFEEDPSRPVGGWVPLGPVRDVLPVINVGGLASGTIFRREALAAAGGFDEGVSGYEDWDLFCRVARMGWRGEVVPKFLSHHRERADSREKVRDKPRHWRQVAELMARHPDLAEHPARTMRLLASMMERRGPKEAT